MGYNARNDEIRDNVERMRREREAYEDALATVEQFNTRLAAKKSAWFWPTIAAALISKHHWLVIACDSCGTVIDLDLTVKRRDPDGVHVCYGKCCGPSCAQAAAILAGASAAGRLQP